MRVPLALIGLLCLAPAQAADNDASPVGPSADPTQVRPGAYVLDPDHGKITWSVSHLGYSTYYGQFTGVTGTLQLDPKAPEKSRLDVNVPLGGVITGSTPERAPRGAGLLRRGQVPERHLHGHQDRADQPHDGADQRRPELVALSGRSPSTRPSTRPAFTRSISATPWASMDGP